MSESDVYRRKILTYKNGSRAERVNVDATSCSPGIWIESDNCRIINCKYNWIYIAIQYFNYLTIPLVSIQFSGFNFKDASLYIPVIFCHVAYTSLIFLKSAFTIVNLKKSYIYINALPLDVRI